jgi:hypothetical protein
MEAATSPLPDDVEALKALVAAIRLAFCWAHVRRKFYELAEGSPVAKDVLRHAASLYAIEDEIRGLSADERRRPLQVP